MGTILRHIVYLLEPVGFVWLLLLVATAWLWRRRQRRVAALTAGAALFMSLIGGSGFAGWLVASLERPAVRTGRLEDIPVADAIVMLGGGVQPSRHDLFQLELTPSGDRALMALELARLGKAPVLVLGGSAHDTAHGPRVEADLLKRWFDTWQLGHVNVVSLGGCDNTHDEAVKVAALARTNGWQRILLVTSAWHMRRAAATFRTAGVPVEGVPCDFQTQVSIETKPGWTAVPRWQGFMKTALYLHEQIGWWSYRRRGWIQEQP